MYQRLTALILHWLRVPPEPHAPHGNPASLRVFRAGQNLFKLKLARWGVTQLLAFAGIVFWVGVFIDVELEVHNRRQSAVAPVDPRGVRSFEDFAAKVEAVQHAGQEPAMQPATPEKKTKARNRNRIQGWAGFKRMLVESALLLPPWALPVLWVLKILGILAYFIQLPFTYLITRLDYEMRWYMVTDRSLRIRHGVWKISESTMSFANIQQVVVSQGPLQRLLGLSDVRVQSAGGGGGGGEKHEAHNQDDMHLGLFHSVTNGSEIRDLILERLRRFRESGLGDPDEKSAPIVPAAAIPGAGSPELLAAARELAAEARALRASLD